MVRSIKWGVYASKKYKSAHGLPDNLDQLKKHALIGATGIMNNLPAYKWLENKLSENIKTRCDELIAMAAFVETGQGLAILPDDQQRPGIKKLFEFDASENSDLWLLTHPDLRHVEGIKRVIQHLAECFVEEKVI